VGTYQRYQRMHWAGKAFMWFMIFFHIGLITLFAVVGADRILQFLFNLARQLREAPYGWLMLAAFMIFTSIPPIFGFSMSVTVAGFAYGIQGFYIAGPAAVIGSAIAFLLLRFLFLKRIKRITSSNEKWQALESVVRLNGTPLIILVRLCPLPWVYSNMFFASIENVSLWQFVLATIVMTPRILLQVFIGSRVALFSDGEHRGEMDTTSKILNAVSIVLGAGIGLTTGILVYRLTLRKIREMEGLPPDVDELAAEAIEDAERRALLGDYANVDIERRSSPP